MDYFSNIALSDEFYSIQLIHQEVGLAIDSNDIEQLKKIIFNKKYLEVSQDEKEQQAFIAIMHSFNYDGQGENLLKYIIFDYKISEENSLKDLPNEDKYQYIKSLFTLRNLNKSLSMELPSKKDNNKKLKV
jgi:hypothetical protein